MSIIAALVRDLKGSLTAQTDDGAKFTIRAPLPANRSLSSRSFQAGGLD